MATEKRLIDANEAKKFAREHIANPYEIMSACAVIDSTSTVDAVEVVHGRWNWIADDVVSCSNCGRNFYSEDDVNAGVTWYYCPKCGAKMDGDGNG